MTLTAHLVLAIVVLAVLVIIQWLSLYITAKGYIQTILRLGRLLDDKNKEIELLKEIVECDNKLHRFDLQRSWENHPDDCPVHKCTCTSDDTSIATGCPVHRNHNIDPGETGEA